MEFMSEAHKKHLDLQNKINAAIDRGEFSCAIELSRTSEPTKNQPQEGRKYDTSKPRMAQLLSDFAFALEAIAAVGEMGAQKYDLHNWPQVRDGVLRYEDAQVRHQLARWRGEVYDLESNIQHRAHEAWNALAHLQLALSVVDATPLKRIVVKSEGTF